MTTRNINELLNLDTYQDMTDEEIDSIIDYKMRIAFDSALTSAVIAEQTQIHNKVAEDNRANIATLRSMVESIVKADVDLKVM